MGDWEFKANLGYVERTCLKREGGETETETEKGREGGKERKRKAGIENGVGEND